MHVQTEFGLGPACDAKTVVDEFSELRHFGEPLGIGDGEGTVPFLIFASSVRA